MQWRDYLPPVLQRSSPLHRPAGARLLLPVPIADIALGHALSRPVSQRSGASASFRRGGVLRHAMAAPTCGC